ncbi:MAG TPA: alpha/beta hydrolase [Puia sp.]|nr:alpha/beta hydrolase [Puia sp.]
MHKPIFFAVVFAIVVAPPWLSKLHWLMHSKKAKGVMAFAGMGFAGDQIKNVPSMYRKLIVVSGILAILAYFAGQFLDSHHSSFTDFTEYLLFPFFCLVFLNSLFLVRIRRISSTPLTRNIFRGMRVTAFLGIVCFLIAVFWPRSFGTPPMQKRADTRYWDLPTGSRIAYTLLPAKGIKKPYPVIYLEGGPGGSIDDGLIRIMSPLAEDGYDVYVYEQVGSGWSERLADIRDYTALRHKRDLEGIVQKIGAKKVILIGQSWGAILAALYTADNPQRVASLILTGPGPIQPLRPELAGIVAPDSLHLRKPYYTNHLGNERANNIRTRAMVMFATLFGMRLASDKEADDFAAYLNSQVNWSTVCDTSRIRQMRPKGGAGFYVQVMTVQSFGSLPDPRPRIRNLPIPLLVIKGQCDNQQWGFTKEYLDLFPHHQLVVIPDAGHGIFVEQPERYLSAIRDFLK